LYTTSKLRLKLSKVWKNPFTYEGHWHKEIKLETVDILYYNLSMVFSHIFIFKPINAH